MKKTTPVIVAALLAQFALAAYFYPAMPDAIVSHWGFSGEPNGYAPKLVGLLVLPAVTTVMLLMFAAIPVIDPLSANIRKFRKQYDTFVAILVLFMLALQADIVLWNVGVFVSPNFIFPVALGAMFYYLGVIFGSVKRNWFIGIRTPWTLSSERVWDETHRVAAKLFKAAGLVAMAGALVPQYALYFVLVPVLAIVAFSFVYSYVRYARQEKRRRAS